MKPRRATSTDFITQKSGQSQISVRETSGWTSTGRTSRDEGHEDLGLRENCSDLVVNLQETGKTSIRSGITSSHLAFCPSRPLCCGSPPSDHLRHPTGMAANQPTLARIGTQKQSREGGKLTETAFFSAFSPFFLSSFLSFSASSSALTLRWWASWRAFSASSSACFLSSDARASTSSATWVASVWCVSEREEGR